MNKTNVLYFGEYQETPQLATYHTSSNPVVVNTVIESVTRIPKQQEGANYGQGINRCPICETPLQTPIDFQMHECE